MSIIILFILIYVITLILFGVTFYCDMDKGESLEHYFRSLDGLDLILIFLLPIFNTIVLIVIVFYFIFSNLWDKIKDWEK